MEKSYTIKYFTNYWKSLLVAIIIAYGSLASGEDLPNSSFLSIPYSDKVIHALMYAGLSIVLLAANNRLAIKRNYLYTLFIATSYGAGMELLQMTLTETRQAEFLDIMANTLGVLVGILIFKILLKKKWVTYL
ncbi:MAG: VanZ family protein [Bacteroidales bacterium]